MLTGGLELPNLLQELLGFLVVGEVIAHGLDEPVQCLGDRQLHVSWVQRSTREVGYAFVVSNRTSMKYGDKSGIEGAGIDERGGEG